jgi:5'-3' exonuclease
MLAIIDGDVLAYVACKNRYQTTIKDFVNVNSFTEEKIPVINDKEYLMQCWDNFQKHLSSLLEACFATHYVMAVKSPVNYRDTIYPHYKANRKNKDPSKLQDAAIAAPILRELAVAEDLAIVAHNREADDFIRIWAEEARAAKQNYIIATTDKDLNCIPGNHFNIKKNLLYEVTELEATRFFYQQLMSGDPIDNVPGLPGIGPVKAERYLYNIHTEAEMQEIVVEMYMSAFEKDWYNMLLSNGKMIYIQKHFDDYFKISDWPVVQGILGKQPKVIPQPAQEKKLVITSKFTGSVPKLKAAV